MNNNAIEQFISAVKEPEYETNTTYSAIVSRVDSEGVAWVNLAGSEKETPTASTSADVKAGDVVTVQWRNNKLYIAGNYSDPSAGVIRVANVEAAANTAREAANNAVIDAGRARDAAEQAEATADSVHGIAVQAQIDADEAKAAAGNASKYAARALGNLSTVQSVTETLNWITQHGTMALTTDVALDPTHVYFVQDAGGDYEVGGVSYSVVTEPKVEDIASYYVLSIDESLNNYVGTHLAVTNYGLNLIFDNSSYRIHIGSLTPSGEEGVYILDENGEPVSFFGESINFSSARPQYIGGEDAHIVFDSADGSITIGGEYVTMISPESVFLWDLVLTVLEREAANEGLDISEDVSTWVYDDFSHAEMEGISEELDIAESTTVWQTSVSVSEYKVLCDGLGIGYQFGRSVYVGMDAISLGDNFFVDPSGYLISSSGKIAGWDIKENALSHGIEGTTDYVELSGEKGIKLGKWFEITPSGVIRARRGIFAGFTMVPVNNGNDYLMSDYETNGVTWRTWIRSAQDKDKGGTWAFSSQYKRNGEDDFFGAFVARSNGELTSLPVDNNGVPLGHAFEVDSNGIYLYPNNTVTSQPNIYWNPSNGYLAYTTWNSSSEKLKKNIKSVTKKAILPENLYDVEIVQFQYKDDVVNKNDQRFGEDLIGFVIEDLDRKYPVAVDKADEKDSTTWAWNSAYLIPAMLKLIQNQHSEIDLLKERQEALEKDIAKIKSILKGDNMK